MSDESGRLEVYVQAFPLTERKAQDFNGRRHRPRLAQRWRGVVLSGCGSQPDGGAGPGGGATAFEPGVAKELFPIPGPGLARSGSGRRVYAPSGDGQRFLIARRLDETSGVPITVVLNWQAGIKK